MSKQIIRNATVINEGISKVADVLINKDKIEKIDSIINISENYSEVDATGLWLIPGVIDDQVHFREPGLTHKADIYSESRAALAGGVTSYMEMPNVIPQTTTNELLEEKYLIGEKNSAVNYSFYLGATNFNLEELKRVNTENVCGANQHPVIRDEQACYMSSSLAVALAKKYNTRLHILHITSSSETGLFKNDIPLSDKRINV